MKHISPIDSIASINSTLAARGVDMSRDGSELLLRGDVNLLTHEEMEVLRSLRDVLLAFIDQRDSYLAWEGNPFIFGQAGEEHRNER